MHTTRQTHNLEFVYSLQVYVSGLDLLDGTPVLDIKPYIRKYDSFQGASAGWLDEVPSDDDAGSSIRISSAGEKLN